MTALDRGLMFKKDFARLIMILKDECTTDQLTVLMGLLNCLNDLDDQAVGEVVEKLKVPGVLEGLI